MKRKPVVMRQWLNKDETQRAYSILSTEDNDANFYGYLRLADCGKEINLDFSIWWDNYSPTKKDFAQVKLVYKDRLNKVDILKKQLEVLQTELTEWYHQFETIDYATAVARSKERKAKKTKRLELAETD